MTVLAAVANGPIAYVSPAGTQTFVPLSAIRFVDGAVTVDSTFQAASAWIGSLVEQGYVRPGGSTPVTAAIVWSAVDPGTAGNATTVSIKSVSDLLFDATAERNERWSGLTPATVGKTLAAHEAIVRVNDATPKMPVKMAKTKLAGGSGTLASKLAIPAKTGDAFTVTARAADVSGDDVEVAIDDVDTNASTFTLTASWKKTASNVDASTAAAKLAALEFVVKATAPDGKTFVLPAEGSHTLSGGVDKATAALVSSARS